jgi:Tfp pilus assembly protein PilF
MNTTRLLIVATLTSLLYACAAPPPAQEESSQEGAQQFAAGIKYYRDGKHDEAARNLQASLYLGLSETDRIQAHKYLAFTHCAAGREDQCRSEFRKALTLDPAFELSAAEAGHPVWGPIFREVKDN